MEFTVILHISGDDSSWRLYDVFREACELLYKTHDLKARLIPVIIDDSSYSFIKTSSVDRLVLRNDIDLIDAIQILLSLYTTESRTMLDVEVKTLLPNLVTDSLGYL